MVAGAELALLVLVIVALLGALRAIKTVTPLVLNAVVGLVALSLAGFVGYGVSVTPVVLLIVALGGLPGAVLVLVMAHFQIAFEPLVLLL